MAIGGTTSDPDFAVRMIPIRHMPPIKTYRSQMTRPFQWRIFQEYGAPGVGADWQGWEWYRVSQGCIADFNKNENQYIMVAGKLLDHGITKMVVIQEYMDGAYEFGPELNTGRYKHGCIKAQMPLTNETIIIATGGQGHGYLKSTEFLHVNNVSAGWTFGKFFKVEFFDQYFHLNPKVRTCQSIFGATEWQPLKIESMSLVELIVSVSTGIKSCSINVLRLVTAYGKKLSPN